MRELWIAAMIVILAHQPLLHTTRLNAPVVTSSTTRADGTVVRTQLLGWAECELTERNGVAVSWRVKRITAVPSSETHEALHGADCVDNGRMDGSLLPFQPVTSDPAHEWVYWAMDNPAEAQRILERVRA